MLSVIIPAKPPSELYDEKENKFIYVPARKEYKLQLEHSLVSLSKWESKWCKPFLSNKGMTDEESIDYIRCMTITQNVPSEAYYDLPAEEIQKISDYINAPMTATTFSGNEKGAGNRKVITSEVIYSWMVALQIPPEYQKWHLNRLLTLIRVCNINNEPPKKMGTKQAASQYAALNAARRAKLNSKG